MQRLESFQYSNVTLKNSHWERQRRDTIELYLEISNDDLLHYFRTLAGLPSAAQGLMGWYGNNACTFGQKIAAFVNLYLVTGDYRLKEKVLYLCEEWGKCAQVSSEIYDVNDTYVYDKLMGGFVQVYEYLHYKPAAEYMRELTKSAAARFSREIKRDGLQDADLSQHNMIEWYTLPENLYRAYELTGESFYYDFAKEWEYPYLWDRLKNGILEIGPRHAYSQVNSLSSAAMAYRIDQNPYYLEVLEAAYEEITQHHMFATGGYGPAECMFTEQEGYLGDSLKDAWDRTKKAALYRNFGDTMMPRNDNWGSCEVSCCAWAVFKLVHYLMRFTGKAKYGDWAEKMLYNGTGGQIPITPRGKVMYYAGYFVDGALKTTEDRRVHEEGPRPGAIFEWQCCTGTFPLDVAEYANLLYYFDEDTLYVSQYLPSSVYWEKKGLVLENYSLYPEEETVRFAVHLQDIDKEKAHMENKPEKVGAKLAFRVPSWATGTNLATVNGVPVTETVCKANEWMILEKEWQEGDIIELHYTFTLRFTPVDNTNQNIAALSYGPLVLCTDTMGILSGDSSKPEEWIKRVSEDDYVFETNPGHVLGYDFDTRVFRPYFSVGEMKWYYMYCKIVK